MRKAEIYWNRELAGELIQENKLNYIFRYNDFYYANRSFPAVSLTLSKKKKEYKSNYLFPFFYNMLSEGVNRKLQCKQLKIDENDYFGLLLKTAQYDTIGAITVKPTNKE